MVQTRRAAPLFGRGRTRDRPGAADRALSQMPLSSPDKKRMGKQAFTCSFCLCSAFDLKMSGREAVEQVCGNLSTAVRRGPGEERSVGAQPMLSRHCSAGYHSGNLRVKANTHISGSHRCRGIGLNATGGCKEVWICAGRVAVLLQVTQRTGRWLCGLKPSIGPDSGRAQVLPGAWRLRGG